MLPKLEIVPIAQAEHATRSDKRAKLIEEYVEYIRRLGAGEAGKLQMSEGETVQAIRRRLGSAAKLIGVELEIRRKDDVVYFWVKSRRRGRPKKQLIS